MASSSVRLTCLWFLFLNLHGQCDLLVWSLLTQYPLSEILHLSLLLSSRSLLPPLYINTSVSTSNSCLISLSIFPESQILPNDLYNAPQKWSLLQNYKEVRKNIGSMEPPLHICASKVTLSKDICHLPEERSLRYMWCSETGPGFSALSHLAHGWWCWGPTTL